MGIVSTRTSRGFGACCETGLNTGTAPLPPAGAGAAGASGAGGRGQGAGGRASSIIPAAPCSTHAARSATAASASIFSRAACNRSNSRSEDFPSRIRFIVCARHRCAISGSRRTSSPGSSETGGGKAPRRTNSIS